MAMLYLDNGIPVNSATFANEETWFELIGAELLVEHSHTAPLVDLPRLQAPNCAKGMLDCTGTYPLAMSSYSRLSLAV